MYRIYKGFSHLHYFCTGYCSGLHPEDRSVQLQKCLGVSRLRAGTCRWVQSWYEGEFARCCTSCNYNPRDANMWGKCVELIKEETPQCLWEVHICSFHVQNWDLHWGCFWYAGNRCCTKQCEVPYLPVGWQISRWRASAGPPITRHRLSKAGGHETCSPIWRSSNQWHHSWDHQLLEKGWRHSTRCTIGNFNVLLSLLYNVRSSLPSTSSWTFLMKIKLFAGNHQSIV